MPREILNVIKSCDKQKSTKAVNNWKWTKWQALRPIFPLYCDC